MQLAKAQKRGAFKEVLFSHFLNWGLDTWVYVSLSFYAVSISTKHSFVFKYISHFKNELHHRLCHKWYSNLCHLSLLSPFKQQQGQCSIIKILLCASRQQSQKCNSRRYFMEGTNRHRNLCNQFPCGAIMRNALVLNQWDSCADKLLIDTVASSQKSLLLPFPQCDLVLFEQTGNSKINVLNNRATFPA